MRLYGIDHEEVYPLVVKGVGRLSEMLLIHFHPRIISRAIAIVVIPIVITDGVVDRDSGRLCDRSEDSKGRVDGSIVLRSLPIKESIVSTKDDEINPSGLYILHRLGKACSLMKVIGDVEVHVGQECYLEATAVRSLVSSWFMISGIESDGSDGERSDSDRAPEISKKV